MFINKNYVYSQCDEMDWDSIKRWANKVNAPLPKVVRKKNLWEFYKSINYDYKTKKYLIDSSN